MPPNRPRCTTDIPGLEWLTTDDGSLTLWDSHLQETYHSGCGAIAESLVVYLVHSGVYHRLAGGLPTSVFEMGLGTGTNLLLTAALAEHFAAPLEYWAIENRLLPSSVYNGLQLNQYLPRAVAINQALDLHQCLNGNPDSFQCNADQFQPMASDADRKISLDHFSKISALSSTFSEWMDKTIATGLTPARSTFPMDSGPNKTTSLQSLQYQTGSLSANVTLHLLTGDALEFINSRVIDQYSERFCAVYFDPFSPEANPALWTRGTLQAMHQLLQPGGTFTSYCVKSRIRRLLQEIGFSVFKVCGPAGGKREVLRATKQS